ncbi:MAG: YoeB-YefM toxin-antitoxin system antitoxin YefM [Neisseria sp.]|nr:YoeB-YefM toxin-antitoxin system antitoxin YefM [Neisseria sp.]
MQAISYSEARQNLANTLNDVVDNQEAMLITRTKGENCVLMSYAQYRSLEETAYLLRSPANAERLTRSIAALRNADGTERELLE